MQDPKYTIVPQAPQFDENAKPEQPRWVKLAYTDIPETRDAQDTAGVLILDADPWSAQKYTLGDQVTATNGLIYEYVYDNRGSMVDGAFINSLDDLIEMLGFKDKPEDFYVLQNPALEQSAVEGIRFWEVDRSINSRAFLDARPTITTGKRFRTQAVFEMNFIPDVMCAYEVDCNSLQIAWQEIGTRHIGPFNGEANERAIAIDADTQSNTFGEFASFSIYRPEIRNSFTHVLITKIDGSRAFRSPQGTYFIGVLISANSNTEVNTGIVSVGQIIFGNRREVGFMDVDSSSQDIEDLSVNTFGLDGALTSLARPSVLNGRQTLLFPRIEMEVTKRFFKSLYPQRNRGLIEHVPSLFYPTEDIRLGALLYGTVSSAATFTYKQATRDTAEVRFDVRELT